MTYEYECKECGTIEVEQKISEEALKECPNCGGEVKRLVSGGQGFQLKGGGWAATNYS